MKNILTALAFSITLLGFSQDKEKNTCVKDSTCSKVEGDLYIGIGGQSNKFNLNNNLKLQNLTEIQTTMPEFVVGVNIFGKKMTGDIEFGFLFSNPKKNGVANKYYGFTGRFRVHYNIVNNEKTAFTTGLSLSSTTAQMDVYSLSNTIDLNDLNPNNNSGHFNLKNQMYYVGPSVSLYLFKKTFPVRLNAGYELAFTRGKWKSDFGDVLNGLNESGNNRFVFGITL